MQGKSGSAIMSIPKMSTPKMSIPKMSIPIMSTVPKCLFPLCLLCQNVYSQNVYFFLHVIGLCSVMGKDIIKVNFCLLVQKQYKKW